MEDNYRLLEICDQLFCSYRYYLKLLYSSDLMTIWEEEQQVLSMIAVSLPCEARKIANRVLDGEIGYPHLFWARIEERLQPISFSYVCWDLEHPSVIPCWVLKNDGGQSEYKGTENAKFLDQNEEQARTCLFERIKETNRENDSNLLNWCSQLYQLMHKYYYEFKYIVQ